MGIGTALALIIMRRELLLGLVSLASAMPAEPTAFEKVVAQAPEPTAVPELVRRDIFDDVETYVEGIVSDVKGEVSSFINSGILDYPNGFPTGTAVKESLGLSDDDDLDALPTHVLNIP